MTNILTPNEAANYLRTQADDPTMLLLLPSIDQFVQRATGRDWTKDIVIHPLAKAAAGMLLVQWYDMPAMVGNEPVMHFGLNAVLSQLEAEALKYRKVEFEGVNGAGFVCMPKAREGDTVISLVGVFGLSGDQSSLFESSVSEEGFLKQNDSGDHSEHIFVAVLKAPADDVVP